MRVAACAAMAAAAAMAADVRVVFDTGKKTVEKTFALKAAGAGKETLELRAEDLPEGTKHFDVCHPGGEAKAGEKGFVVFPSGFLTDVSKEREDGSFSNWATVMPLFGWSNPRGSCAAVLRGMRYEAYQRVELKKGVYRPVIRYLMRDVKDGKFYSPVTIDFHNLPPHATYAQIARVYRDHQIAQGEIRPLRERVKTNPILKRVAEMPEIRIRMGWKPAPSPVKEQTLENEPEMKVAVTFDRVKDLIRGLKKSGVDGAELCLVGWNTKGHDGRYPQIFPVEPALGGEAKLRELVKFAKENGFLIVGHNNYSDAYSVSAVAGLWDGGAYLLRGADGKFKVGGQWSGGQMYQTCVKEMFGRFLPGDYAKMKDLGFEGCHYTDVFSTVAARTCHHPDHPLTKEEYADWTEKIFAAGQKTFGAQGSEGGYDWAVKHLDYALYLSFHNPGTEFKNKLIDAHVPLWELVYHGYVLSNPYCATTNYTIKDRLTQLKLLEVAGRPMFYVYSKFTANAWMGKDDVTCATEEELAAAVEAIRKGWAEYGEYRRLQYETMDAHDEVAPGVFRSTFSDGSRIFANFTQHAYRTEKGEVGPMDWRLESIW